MQTTELPIYDLYDVWYQPFWRTAWFWWLCVFLILLFMCLVIFLIIKKIKSRKITKEPWQQALEQLKLIDLATYKDPKTHKQFYAALTSILKSYFSDRYHLALVSKTDEEVVALWGLSELPQELHHKITGIFQGAQSIKFANQDARLEKMSNDLKVALDLVNSTIPVKNKTAS